MAFKKQKFPMMMLPAGPFVYPKIVEPDYGTDENPMPDGKLSVTVRLSAEQAEPFITQIDELAAASLKAAIKADKRDAGKKKKAPWTTKHLPYELELDEDGDETGDVLIKANMRHSGINKKTDKKWSRLCPLFDAMGNCRHRGRHVRSVCGLGCLRCVCQAGPRSCADHVPGQRREP